MTELKRENMEQLAQALKELLQGKRIIYTAKERRHWRDDWGEEVEHRDCTINENGGIRFWFRPDVLEGTYVNAKSHVALLLRTRDNTSLHVPVFHPCVRFGGGNYPKHGQVTKFALHPDKVEFDAWNSNSFHTLQVS